MLSRLFGKASLIAAALFCSQMALAIGPNTQVVSPVYNSVVRVEYDAGLGGGVGFFEGTGSIVGNSNVGGNGYLWVLTSDHVISSTGAHGGSVRPNLGIAFGNSPTSSGNTTYFANALATAPNIYRGGSTGFEDLALFGINYGAFDSSKSALAVNLIPVSGLMSFTEIGFGNQGNLVANGYAAQNKYGTQRYFNQTMSSLTPNYTSAGYTFTAAKFIIQDPASPTAPAGSGAALDADSGSPWFSSAGNGTYFTNNQFAVLQGYSGTPYLFGTTELANALTQADVDWIAARVPEPGSLGLVLGAIVLLIRRRRSCDG